LKTAEIKITGAVEGEGPTVQIELTDPDGAKVVEREFAVSKKGVFEGTVSLTSDPQLWYPFTYGSSPLYTVTASLPGHDSQTRKLGLRRLRLLQHELKGASGTSFLFEINNLRVFAGGSCWIPGDYMLPRMTRQRYEDWLLLAKSGNQVMVSSPFPENTFRDYKRLMTKDTSLGWRHRRIG
jgi:beta-mannosidase